MIVSNCNKKKKEKGKIKETISVKFHIGCAAAATAAPSAMQNV